MVFCGNGKRYKSIGTINGMALASSPSRIAYRIPLPYDGKDLEVQFSANAWWMDQTKIPFLFAAFKIGATIPEACAAAGITLRQYKYFVSLHPEVNQARETYKAYPGLTAKRTVARALENGDVKTAKWYLSKVAPEEWGRKRNRKNLRGIVVGSDTPLSEKDEIRQKYDVELQKLLRKNNSH